MFSGRDVCYKRKNLLSHQGEGQTGNKIVLTTFLRNRRKLSKELFVLFLRTYFCCVNQMKDNFAFFQQLKMTTDKMTET
jgi:hypothetical protein